jgi:hypothetical protein
MAELRRGLPEGEYERLLTRQDGKCGGCARADDGEKRFAIDHDHVTGEVRGLLCETCNIGLGYLKDNPQTLQRLLDYLKADTDHDQADSTLRR